MKLLVSGGKTRTDWHLQNWQNSVVHLVDDVSS